MSSSPEATQPSQPTLPDTMAGLLEVAISDCRKLDGAVYQPHCENWHKPEIYGMCSVCLAGGVIAGTLQADPEESIYPDAYSESVTRKLGVLDSMRSGCWVKAYIRFYDSEPSFGIREALTFVPQPVNPDFRGWDEFTVHLDSLEKAIPTPARDRLPRPEEITLSRPLTSGSPLSAKQPRTESSKPHYKRLPCESSAPFTTTGNPTPKTTTAS